MNLERRIWRLGSLLMLLLALLSTRLVYWQLVRGEELLPVSLDLFSAADKDPNALKKEQETQDILDVLTGGSGQNIEEVPQPVIQRTVEVLRDIHRGSIYDRNGRILAYDTLAEDGSRTRFYTEPSLAPVVGYVSGLRVGLSGLELSYNDTLFGLDRADVQLAQLFHQPFVGSDLTLTIDSRVQRSAADALAGRAGAVVAIDGRTGGVLAMVSSPHIDPNRMLETGYVSELLGDCGDGSGGGPECEGLFINRATQGQYTPGSTFKTVTLLAALDTELVTRDTVFDFGQPVNGPNGSYYVYEVDGGVIPDPNHRERKLDLDMAYAKSANAAFARMADELGGDRFLDYAARLGFSSPNPFAIEIPYIPAKIANDPNDLRLNNLLRAATGIGQGELFASPMSMAMVALPVINNGNLPIPYFVETVRNPTLGLDGNPGNRHTRRGLIKEETARQVHDIMMVAVNEGSGQAAKVRGLTVGGKTGTAQLGGVEQPHAWFIGFAEEDDRSVVIAVVVENAGGGSQVAAPVFAQVAETALRELGEPVEEIFTDPPPPAPRPGEIVLQAVEPEPVAAPTNLLPADLPRRESKLEFITNSPGSCRDLPAVAASSGSFGWPSNYHTLSGGDFAEGHPGVDLAAPSGSAVFAADAGLVIYASWTDVGYGNVIVIDHGNGYRTLYAHLSLISTACGAIVEPGQVIGLSGNTGNSVGPHLHFEVRVPEGYVDPKKVLPTQ